MSNLPELPKGWKYGSVVKELGHLWHQLSDRMVFSYGHAMYRGEPQWYVSRRSTLGRLLPTGYDPRDERSLIRHFLQAAHALLAPSDLAMMNNAVGWLTMLQHHGVPTRLLDWTFSSWVAAYFAAGGDLREPGFIWCFDLRNLHTPAGLEMHKRVCEILETDDTDRYSELVKEAGSLCAVVGSVQSSARMVAQQSLYTFVNPIDRDHAIALADAAEGKVNEVLVISPVMKAALRRALFAMNLTAASLFPGIDGVGRKLREAVAWEVPIPTL